MQKFEFTFTPLRGWQGLPDASFEPDLVLFFGSKKAFDDGAAYFDLRSRFPKAIVFGCSGGGQIHSSGIIDDGITGLALKFKSTKLKLVSISSNDSDESLKIGNNLGRQLLSSDLVGVFVLSEGLEINGDNLMEGLSQSLPNTVVIGGGLAADDDRFARTTVSANCLPMRNLVAAVGFYGPDVEIKSSNGGGWKKTGKTMKITASRDNHLYDLNDEDALSIYKNNLGSEAAQLPMSGLRFPLMVSDPNDSEKSFVRTLLGIDNDVGMLTFAGNIPEGWTAEVMQASSDDLIEAASSAALETLSSDDKAPDVSILVSCIGRRLVLGDKSVAEVNAVDKSYGQQTAMTGFYSYGEFSKTVENDSAHLFNQSLALFTITERI
jgi:hypothetical protein